LFQHFNISRFRAIENNCFISFIPARIDKSNAWDVQRQQASTPFRAPGVVFIVGQLRTLFLLKPLGVILCAEVLSGTPMSKRPKTS
jgi:hypothetical protein